MLGLGSYSFFWQQSNQNPQAISLIDAFTQTAELGVQLFQICDYLPLEQMTTAEIEAAAKHAKDLSLEIELGTKGIEPARLAKFLELAKAFDAKLIRSMPYSQDSRPTTQEAIEILQTEIKAFEKAGVVLALETYEQISTQELVAIVSAVNSPNLGICLDPANVVANLENPQHCVELAAPYVKSIHAKDFAFARQEGWVGFTYSGAVMGEGLHDYPHLLSVVKPREHGINEIVEHWLPWQGTIEETIAMEKQWTKAALDYLRSTK
jgi:sugar phosphate isomerase/epimerase